MGVLAISAKRRASYGSLIERFVRVSTRSAKAQRMLSLVRDARPYCSFGPESVEGKGQLHELVLEHLVADRCVVIPSRPA